MSDRLAQSYDDLASVAAGVLRGFVVCEVDELPLAVLAAAAGVSEAEAGPVADGLVRDGWLTARGPGWFATTSAARAALGGLAPTRRGADAMAAAARGVGEHLRAAAAVVRRGFADAERDPLGWARRHGPLVAGVVRSAHRHGEARLAVEIAAVWWRVTEDVPEAPWRHDLARAGEEAAIAVRDPAALADLLSRSAGCAVRAGDFATAEAQWVRALAVFREAGDQAAGIDVLRSLGSLYRRWGRLHRALDVYLDLLATHESIGDGAAIVETLGWLEEVLLAAGRPEAAEEHLARAVGMAETSTRFDERARAELLILLGRARWHAGRPGPARQAFSGALALLVDRDEARADQVRAMLATGDGRRLPGDDGERDTGSGPGAPPPAPAE
ncbi:tetratricopeptide repeat protein [Amycolatopsis anabasis]|uniref:tetratricopeptide repeat protein n=1 Tax=Amycolatopsis anabasis TaxID=1840409 RepID=UPI00131ADC22|nr:tetratricopeptide repeat protein [Amycolatopsis anabasis]